MSCHLIAGLLGPSVNKDKIFIETPQGRTLSYGDMLAQSARIAQALAKRGVKTGDRVAVQVNKSVEAILLYLGTVRLGAVLLPLNTAYTLVELEYFIGDAEPSLIVCDPAVEADLRPIAERYGARVETLDGAGKGTLSDLAAKMDGIFEDADRGPDDLAGILYTSGTTGRPKGAMLTHNCLLSNTLMLRDYWHFTSDDVLLHVLPIFHTHGLFVATNTAMAAGASMLFLSKFDPDDVIRLLPRSTVMMGVPTFYTRLLQHEKLNKDLVRNMRLFISGSAPLLAETHREWRERTGHAILERYGMTEINMASSNPYDGERIAGTVGFPLPGVAVRVVDPESSQPCGENEIGMIEVKGPSVFKGYWRNPEKTKEEFKPDGFFITGDLGKFDERGYLHIVGRGKDLIITGGFNVYPKEVETEIDALPGVIESAVIGVPHPDFGEGVTAVVVTDGKGEGKITETSVLDALNGRLAKFKIPKRVIVRGELPRNAMGKVQKNVLRDEFHALYAGQTS